MLQDEASWSACRADSSSFRPNALVLVFRFLREVLASVFMVLSTMVQRNNDWSTIRPSCQPRPARRGQDAIPVLPAQLNYIGPGGVPYPIRVGRADDGDDLARVPQQPRQAENGPADAVGIGEFVEKARKVG